MSIKGKFFLIQFLIVLIFCIYSISIVKNFYNTKQQVRMLNGSTEELISMVEINLNLGLQLAEVMDYLLGEDEAIVEFERLNKKTLGFFDALQEQKLAYLASIDKTEISDIERIEVIKGKYLEFLNIIQEIWSAKDEEKHVDVYTLLNEKLKPMRDYFFFNLIDYHISNEYLRIETAYDNLAMYMGVLPNLSGQNFTYTKKARLSFLYFLSIENLFSDINLSVHYLSDYILFKEEISLNKLSHLDFKIEEDFWEIKKIIEHWRSIGSIENQDYERVAQKTLESYGRLFEVQKEIIKIVNAKGDNNQLKIEMKKFEKVYESDNIPNLTYLLHDAQLKIKSYHNKMLAYYLKTVVSSLIILFIVSILIVFTIYKITRRIVVSLKQLSYGAEKFGKGRLNFRINLAEKDELGNLSTAFNKMASSLQEKNYLLDKSKNDLINAKEYTENILLSMNDTIFVVSPDKVIKKVNIALCKLLEYTENELMGENAEELFFASMPNCSDLLHQVVKNQGCSSEEVTYINKFGEEIFILFSASLLFCKNGEIDGMICAGQNISKRKIAEQQLAYDLLHDSLTGLPNRALLMKKLKYSIKSIKKNNKQSFALLVMDLDRFKVINDSMGHVVGDKLLVSISKRLQKKLSKNITLARMGGDEFAVIIEALTENDEITKVTKVISDCFIAPFKAGGKMVSTSISIGVALSNKHYKKPEEIIRDADTAMYRAKALGKGRCKLFDKQMHHEAVSIMEMEADLRKGLIDKPESFLLYFQPIYSLKKNKIVGAEVLIRWNHPEKGLILPSTFIELAEETGMILALGQWVLQAACKSCKKWHDAGFEDLSISVNFSASQFLQHDLIDIIKSVIYNTGIKPEKLNVEITESTAMSNIDLTIKTLKKIKSFGSTISLDDFGTGYSSMEYLKRLEIDSLKIDRSFVKDIPNNSDDIEITKAIIALAHSLNLEVIAEGVQTEAQLVFLESLECSKVQGYLLGRPIPEDEFWNVLKEKSELLAWQ